MEMYSSGQINRITWPRRFAPLWGDAYIYTYCSAYKIPTLHTILRQLNPFHTVMTNFLKDPSTYYPLAFAWVSQMVQFWTRLCFFEGVSKHAVKAFY